jgi:hypothetical protein
MIFLIYNIRQIKFFTQNEQTVADVEKLTMSRGGGKNLLDYNDTGEYLQHPRSPSPVTNKIA